MKRTEEEKQDKRPLEDRVVHLVVGAVIGALVGLAVWLFATLGMDFGWVVIPGISLVMGMAAAVMGERFWEEWFGNG
jgi:hypothetical protein